MQNTLHSLLSPVLLLSPVFCLLYSFAKRHLNYEKCLLIKGKSTKIAAAFIKNKANFVNSEIGLSSFMISRYEILPAWRGEKTNPIQTQFKPNYRKAKNEHKFYYNNELQDFSPLAGHKNKPNSNPNS